MATIPKPVLHLKMQGNANDSSGYDNNGTVTDATLTTDRYGNPNSAYNFNGSSAYITIPYTTTLSITGGITIYIAFKTTTSATLLSKQTSTTGSGSPKYNVDILSSNLRFFGYTTAGAKGIVSGSYNPTDGLWKLAIFTFDGTTWNIYVNGELKQTLDDAATLEASAFPVYIGTRSTDTSFFNGTIGAVMIYDVTLTPTQVKYLYDKTKRNYI